MGGTGGRNITSIGAAADELSVAYEVGLPAIGALAAALFMAQLVMQVPVARLVDRFGARPTGLVSIGAFTGFNLLACVAPDATLAFVCRGPLASIHR